LKENVIQGFRTNIDISKLGYQYFAVDIYLKEYKQRKKLIDFIRFNPYLMCIDVNIGLSHLQLEFHVKDITHLHQILQEISNKFPNAIRNYKNITVQKVHKLIWMPEV
jgi:hypothetical protein